MSSPNTEALSSTLDNLSNTIQEHVNFKSDGYPNVLALWAAGSYLIDHWPHLFELLIVSPERKCGKTIVFETTEASVCKWKMASSITPAEIC